MELTRILSLPWSAAIDIVRPMTAALDVVYGGTAVGPQAGYGGYVDDGPAVRLDHPGNGVPARQDDALDVDRHHIVPVLLADFHHGTPPRDPHVVVQDVQAAVSLDGRLHHAAAVLGRAKVGLEYRCLAPLLPDHGEGLLGPLGDGIDEQDFGALTGEHHGGGLPIADALAAGPGPGNDGHLSFQPGTPLRHGTLPLARLTRHLDVQ